MSAGPGARAAGREAGANATGLSVARVAAYAARVGAVVGRWARACGWSVLAGVFGVGVVAHAAPHPLCPGSCEGGTSACGGDDDCEIGPCVFADECLPGLAGLVAEVVPEGPGGLNDPRLGWTCGYVSCAAADTHLEVASDYGITAVATKDIALQPGRRYLALAEMRADEGTWGYFDVVAFDVGGTSEPVVAPEWTPVSAFFEVPMGHSGPIQFRLHVDGPGRVGVREIRLLELRDYGLFVRFRVPSQPGAARVSAGFMLRQAGDGPGYYPGRCGEVIDATCVDPALLTADAEPGAPTPWLEASRWFPAGAGWRVTAAWHVSALPEEVPVEGGAVEVEVAWAPREDAITWRGEHVFEGDRFALSLPEGVPHPLRLSSEPVFVADTVARDRAAVTPAATRPTTFKVGTIVNILEPFESSRAFVRDGLALLADLGLTAAAWFTALPTPEDRAAATELGLVDRFVHAEHLLQPATYTEVDFDRDALAAMVEANLEDPYWERELGGVSDPTRVFAILGDEIGGLAFAGPAYRAAYLEWLAQQGVSAEELGLARLENALPLESMGWWRVPEVRPDPEADPLAARRYLYALRFWNQATAEAYALGRRALAERFGALPAAFNAGTPLAGTYFQLALGADLQAMAKGGALSGFLGEGFLGYLDDCLAWQLGVYADYAAGVTAPWREAAAARGERFPLASYLHAYRGDSGAKLLELAARGFEWFNHYSYGPYDLSTGDGAGGFGVISAPWLERVRDGSELLARAEPLLAGATRPPSPIVMLASQSDSVWTDEGGVTSEEIGWHLALSHSHHPIDFMLEDEVAAGLLDHPFIERRVLIVMRKHVSNAAWRAIERWVEAGGTLILGGGLATHDEYGAFVRDREAWSLVFADGGEAGGQEVLRWATPSGTASFSYGGPWRRLVSIIGTPIAVSDDDRPVAMRIARGRGRIVALGLDLGTHYGQPELTCDGTRPANLPQRPSGFSAVVRAVIAGLVEDAGASAPVRADAPTLSIHRLLTRAGAPLVLVIPWGNGPVSAALVIPEAARCSRVREEIEGAELPLTFGTLLATIERPAIFTWRAEDCERPIEPEPTPEVVEPEPRTRDEGCAGGGGAGTLLLAVGGLAAIARRWGTGAVGRQRWQSGHQ